MRSAWRTGEQRRLGAADRLGGAVLALQFRIQPLELFEPVHHRVVLGIVDEHGVALVVRLAQLEDALLALALELGVAGREEIHALAASVVEGDAARALKAIDDLAPGQTAPNAQAATTEQAPADSSASSEEQSETTVGAALPVVGAVSVAVASVADSPLEALPALESPQPSERTSGSSSARVDRDPTLQAMRTSGATRAPGSESPQRRGRNNLPS